MQRTNDAHTIKTNADERLLLEFLELMVPSEQISMQTKSGHDLKRKRRNSRKRIPLESSRPDRSFRTSRHLLEKKKEMLEGMIPIVHNHFPKWPRKVLLGGHINISCACVFGCLEVVFELVFSLVQFPVGMSAAPPHFKQTLARSADESQQTKTNGRFVTAFIMCTCIEQKQKALAARFLTVLNFSIRVGPKNRLRCGHCSMRLCIICHGSNGTNESGGQFVLFCIDHVLWK